MVRQPAFAPIPRVLGPRLLAFRVLALSMLAALLGTNSTHAAVDRCLALSQAPDNGPAGTRFALPKPAPVWPVLPAQASRGKLAFDEVRLTFVGHSTFEIVSPEGVRMATDYNDYVRPVELPNIATMNRAHSSHFTHAPSPMIEHVLPGWNPLGGPARHDITFKDVHVRNVPTSIRDGFGRDDDRLAPGAFGNSIFIFQMAGLCIGHLGHLHHLLKPEQLVAIGQLDVLLVPVDGGYTLDTAGMAEVVRELRARLIIPMHYFGQGTLNRFLERVRGEFPVENHDSPTIVLSQKTLPREPKILVLPGY